MKEYSSLFVTYMTLHDKDKFLEVYNLYADAIYRHCFFRVYSKARAEDLTQETFMKTWVYLSEGNQVENIRALLYKVATNLIIDESRKKKEEYLDQLLEDKKIQEPSYAGHREIEKEAMIKDVIRHVKELPEEEQQLLLLRYVDDLDPKEIAEILGITANNVSVKLHRAVKLLKGEFS
jgi:RNA polymerase sigma-70 factor (ECF subfamily)